MLTSSYQPRINEEIKRVLQLVKNNRVGDWYLYPDHREIRIYGCQLTPYKLPKYLPMRIFVLEYFGKIINSDEVNFLSARKIPNVKSKTNWALLFIIIGKLGKK